MFAKFARFIRKTDRRQDRRMPSKLHGTAGDIEGRLTDISLGGCGFYPNNGSLQLGEEVSMTLHLKGGDIHIPAKVTGHDHEQVVYGIAFLEVTPMIFDRIEQVLAVNLTPDE